MIFHKILSIDFLGPFSKFFNFKSSLKLEQINTFNKMKSDYLRVPVVLHDLQGLASQEKASSSLTALYKIISSSQEEIEFLYKLNGIHIVMNFLKCNDNLGNICLKVLIKASKRNEKVRMKLLKNNILHLLAVKLQKETDFSKSSLILYSTLIIVLVHGNYEAQNLMRTSGCLSIMVYALSYILDEAEGKPVPCKNAELILYAIIASCKDPRNPENQAEIGLITPKILEYLGKQTHFSDTDHLEVLKCLWLFLKCALHQNERNQQIFFNCSGLGVIFRSIQNVVDEGQCDEIGDLLVKITGVLVKLKSHLDFLFEASNYCPLMILCSLLKSANMLVVQNSIIFLDSLLREVPQALEIIKDKEIFRGIEKAKLMFNRCQITGEICQSLLDRIGLYDGVPKFQENSPLYGQYSFSSKRSLTFRDFRSELEPPQSYFCVVHDTAANHSNSSFGSWESSEEFLNKSKNKKIAHIHFRRKHLKEKGKHFKKFGQRSYFYPPKKRVSVFNIRNLLGGKINQIFQKFCSFFTGLPDAHLTSEVITNETLL